MTGEQVGGVATAPGSATVRRSLAGNKWVILAILVMMSAGSYMDRTIISLLVDQIRADLGVSDLQIGLLQGIAFGLFYASAMIPAGWLVDRYSRRNVLLSGFTFWTFAAASCGLARNYTQLFLARMGVGAGEATLAPACYSLVADVFRRNQLALAISIFAAGSTIGSGIALGLGGMIVAKTLETGPVVLPLLGEVKPWQLAFMLTAVLALPLVLLLIWMREPARSGGSADPASWRDVFAFMKSRGRVLSVHFGGFSLLSAATYGCAAWLPTYFMRHHGMDVATTGLAVGTVGAIAGITGSPLSGFIVDRWFGKGCTDAHFRFFLFTGPVIVLITVMGFWVLSIPILAIAVWGCLHFLWPFGGIAPAFLQLITPPRLRGRVSGIYVLCVNLCGLAIGPAMVAALNEHVFGDPASIGKAVALTFALLVPLAVLLFATSLGHVRAAVAAASLDD
ncbi:MFS transporter [soil metagenome]